MLFARNFKLPVTPRWPQKPTKNKDDGKADSVAHNTRQNKRKRDENDGAGAGMNLTFSDDVLEERKEERNSPQSRVVYFIAD